MPQQIAAFVVIRTKSSSRSAARPTPAGPGRLASRARGGAGWSPRRAWLCFAPAPPPPDCTRTAHARRADSRGSGSAGRRIPCRQARPAGRCRSCGTNPVMPLSPSSSPRRVPSRALVVGQNLEITGPSGRPLDQFAPHIPTAPRRRFRRQRRRPRTPRSQCSRRTPSDISMPRR